MVPIKVKKALYLVEEKIPDLKAGLEEALSGIDHFDKINEDKVKWAIAKLSDLERLLTSIK